MNRRAEQQTDQGVQQQQQHQMIITRNHGLRSNPWQLKRPFLCCRCLLAFQSADPTKGAINRLWRRAALPTVQACLGKRSREPCLVAGIRPPRLPKKQSRRGILLLAPGNLFWTLLSTRTRTESRLPAGPKTASFVLVVQRHAL